MNETDLSMVLLDCVLNCDPPIALPVKGVCGKRGIDRSPDIDQQRPKSIQLHVERLNRVDCRKEKVPAPRLLECVVASLRDLAGRELLWKRREKLAAPIRPAVIRTSELLVSIECR